MAHIPRPICNSPAPAEVPAAALTRAVGRVEGLAFGIGSPVAGLDPCEPGSSLSRQP